MVVDITRANHAIKRTMRILPIMEELLCELDNAQYFSKLGAAYQQIALDSDFKDHLCN